MLKVLGETLLGLLLSGSGIYTGYFYLNGVDQGRTPFLLLLSLVLIGGGVYLLIRAARTEDTMFVKPSVTTPITKEGERLKKNNELANEWKRTMDQRDRLKMLEVSAEANDS